MKIATGFVAIGLAITGAVGAPPTYASGGCAPGYVVGVPMSDGRLPVKCVPKNNVPPGYVDGTGGNAQLAPGYGPTGDPQ